jgi:hypothetical protein
MSNLPETDIGIGETVYKINDKPFTMAAATYSGNMRRIYDLFYSGQSFFSW